MDYAKVEASINTGNISNDDFLAVFSSGATITTTAATVAAVAGAAASSSLAHGNPAATLNPPLVTVDGQVQLPNLLEMQPPVNDTIYLLNGSLYNNSLQLAGSYYNQTTANMSMGLLANSSNGTEVHWDGRYPSGYTLTHIVIASIIVTILMIIIVVGNMLVIIAIATEKSLKNIQNWFIASLAVADFFLGLIIMPFSLANELMGYWIFGSWWCDIHSAMDVLLCTASIMNLCLISLDRYWSITKAVDYLKSRTPARAAVMITAVWIMSALICIPPLLGWKVKMPEGPLPKCEAISMQTSSSSSSSEIFNFQIYSKFELKQIERQVLKAN
ncbi:hypothetical protein AWZ03_003985 [Drosophila navojoa]|uniref:G-protein coupled receptors family 1 profile domain-containing protein n=1 Tax=Drosophila navojoa TaxID=7232 RepID=A0A484BLE0_DRONA|nr:hypothetical protein AWZ03_003985 [Drosophila navojoa]